MRGVCVEEWDGVKSDRAGPFSSTIPHHPHSQVNVCICSASQSDLKPKCSSPILFHALPIVDSTSLFRFHSRVNEIYVTWYIVCCTFITTDWGVCKEICLKPRRHCRAMEITRKGWDSRKGFYNNRDGYVYAGHSSLHLLTILMVINTVLSRTVQSSVILCVCVGHKSVWI